MITVSDPASYWDLRLPGKVMLRTRNTGYRQTHIVIRTAEDLKVWERTIAELTDRLAALLLAEAMQIAPPQPSAFLSLPSIASIASTVSAVPISTTHDAWCG